MTVGSNERVVVSPPIRVRGARTHNLAGVDVDIPTGRFVVITGPSGSGKSSLAFDTVFAEAQRRYLEALSTELRAQASRLPRPDVDSIEGLMPAIALDQRTLPRSPRSTLGTVTEIADHLRLLYARVGVPHCPICGEVVRAETPQEIVDVILQKPEKTRVIVRAPVARGLVDLEPLFDRLRKDGWVRAVVDGDTIDLGAPPKLSKKPHDVDVVVDRFAVKEGIRSRASDSIELALRAGEGRMRLEMEADRGSAESRAEGRSRAAIFGETGKRGDATTPGELSFHSQRFACEKDDYVFPEIEPALFSFNAQAGACPTCQGLGAIRQATEESAVPDRSRTLRDGAVAAWGAPRSVAYAVEVKRAVDALGIDPDVPWEKLPAAQREALMSGGAGKKKKPYEGIARFVEERIAAEEDVEDEGALDLDALEALREDVVCNACGGSRLRPEARAVELGGKSISDLGAMPLEDARAHLGTVFPAIPERMRDVAKPILEGALVRLDALIEVGLGPLPLDRTTRALSAGETERARLAGIAAGGLRSVLYVLDEPSRGLHPSDTERLIAMLRRLRDGGASVVVVDHDLELIRAADHVIDVGPEAGKSGGRIVSQGAPNELAGVTGPWLRGERTLPKVSRKSPSGTLKIRGARDLDIPLGVLTAIVGRSGVGKSAFVHGSLVPAVRASLDGTALPRSVKKLEGASALEGVVSIDQAPLGRSARSNAATATGIMPRLREIFASMPEAKARGFKAARFSTNVKGGRCEACQGAGVVRIEMRFLPDVFVTCEVCKGRRYDRETLEVRFRGYDIGQILESSVDDAQRIFENVPAIREKLDAMRSVGLGYLPLGQPATTLSGGEAQRVRLARELARARSAKTLYVLDEPTAGLHPSDLAVLLDALVALRDQGATVVVVEHDRELIARADHVIELHADAPARRT